MKKEIKTGKYDNGNGQVRFEYSKVNGKLHGISKWWYDHGKPDAQISFFNNRRHGTAIWWCYSGHLFLFKLYQQGVEIFELNFSAPLNDMKTHKTLFSKSQFKQLCQKKT